MFYCMYVPRAYVYFSLLCLKQMLNNSLSIMISCNLLQGPAHAMLSGPQAKQRTNKFNPPGISPDDEGRLSEAARASLRVGR